MATIIFTKTCVHHHHNLCAPFLELVDESLASPFLFFAITKAKLSQTSLPKLVGTIARAG
jgi:hypothetical protein